MDEIEWMVSLLTTYGSFLPSSSNYSCLAARNQPTTPSQRVVFQPSTVRSLWAHVVFKPISGCPIFRPSDASSLMEEASCVWFGARLSEPMGPNPPREWVRSNNPINVMKSIEIRLFFGISCCWNGEILHFSSPNKSQKAIFVGLLRSPENPSANYLEVADIRSKMVKDDQRSG